MTALAQPELLERVSEVVAPQQRSGARADADLMALTDVERRRLSNLLARLTTLAEAAAEVRPMRDHQCAKWDFHALQHGMTAAQI